MGSRLSWPQIRQTEEFRGRWVALDHCTYDARTAQPLEGTVVDSDEDLVELCNRMQQSDNKHCAILFCGFPDDEPSPQSTRGATPIPARAYH
jgi:hypothetical protein